MWLGRARWGVVAADLRWRLYTTVFRRQHRENLQEISSCRGVGRYPCGRESILATFTEGSPPQLPRTLVWFDRHVTTPPYKFRSQSTSSGRFHKSIQKTGG